MTDELVNLLNETIAMELGASIRYMWQYVILERTVNPSLKDTFKDISIEKLNLLAKQACACILFFRELGRLHIKLIK